MGKIQIVKEKSGQTKYKMNLPKKIMETLIINSGDELELINFMGDTMTFKLKRKQ